MKKIAKFIVAAVVANTAALMASMVAMMFIVGPHTPVTGPMAIWAAASLAVLVAGFVILCGAIVWELVR